MAVQGATVVDDRFLTSGDEAGTAPGDRAFRPDVEGLRAVAVMLVVLYHAGLPHLTGGFVGVDVFFVISGFVITGLLLRERESTGSTSVLDFYARRVRRILPAGTLVILVTVASSYLVLGALLGNNVADDGRWAAVFLSNVHFESVGTNYLAASLPPSPLQNYWSLSVEEQFYVVYPTVFLLVAGLKTLGLRSRLAMALGLIALVSFGLSISQTASHPLAAYFSPLTRAWELALGGLVALGTSWLRRIPTRGAVLLTWAGLAAVVWSAFLFNAQTPYPGWRVALPVVGAASIIAGGTAATRGGTESLLGLKGFQWLGARSYSLYLWHWPILVIAAERVNKSSLSVGTNLVLVVVAVIASAITYRVIEHPIRRLTVRPERGVMVGLVAVISTVILLSLAIGAETGSTNLLPVVPAANAAVVLREVALAPSITTVPPSIRQRGYGATYDQGAGDEGPTCQAQLGHSSETICVLGDGKAARLMVLYGDSKALMWQPAFKAIATVEHWRLVVLAKPACPAAAVTIRGVSSWGEGSTTDPICDHWHRWATAWIRRHRPSLLVVSEANYYNVPGAPGTPLHPFTPTQWQHGLEELFRSVSAPNMRTVLLGTTPILGHYLDSGSPACLSDNPDNVQRCSLPTRDAVPQLDQIERATALANQVSYIDTVPWFCSSVCTPIIGKYEVYDATGVHVSGPWARYLRTVLAQALGFPTPHWAQ
jgi:peptidoglycan/LPS O-acetylase OafA/YrhL